MRLKNLINDVAEMRAELRRQGASVQAIAEATERMVRDTWEPLVPPERTWPARSTLPTCAYCDGTGLVIHRNVTNRLGLVVDEGVPCRCPLGLRFEPKLPTDDDHTQAGKVPKKTLTRLGR